MCSIVIAPTVAGRAVVKPINLGEVALYDVNGTQIPGDTLTFKLSSLCCGGAYPARFDLYRSSGGAERLRLCDGRRWLAAARA